MPLIQIDVMPGGITLPITVPVSPIGQISEDFSIDQPTTNPVGINYNEVSKEYKITWKQTIKVRKIFSNEGLRKGYPVKLYCGLQFFSGLAIWIPFGFEIDVMQTIALWRSSPDTQFRCVRLRQTIQEIVQSFIPDILAEIIQFLDRILGGSSYTANDYSPNSGSGITEIYPYIAFKNTMNDQVIYNNWDYVVRELNSMGY